MPVNTQSADDEESTKNQLLFEHLRAEQTDLRRFLGKHIPPGRDSPRLVVLEEMNRTAGAFALVEENTIFYSARLAAGVSYDELKAILAHELGHILLKDEFLPWARIFLNKAAAFFLFYAVMVAWVTFVVILSRVIFGETVIPFSGIFYFLLACGMLSLFFLHLLSLVAALAASRRAEYDADKFTASVMDPAVLARALVKMGKINGFVSLPRSASFFQEHPHLPYRLRYLRRWRDEKRRSEREKNTPAHS